MQCLMLERYRLRKNKMSKEYPANNKTLTARKYNTKSYGIG